MVTNGELVNDFKDCPITATIEVIGGKWKPLILYCLTLGRRRFGEISVRIPAISRKVLAQQLRELEKDGLVTRQHFKEMPPRVEYALTDRSKSLEPVFKEIAKWGNQNLLNRKIG